MTFYPHDFRYTDGTSRMCVDCLRDYDEHIQMIKNVSLTVDSCPANPKYVAAQHWEEQAEHSLLGA